MQPYRPNDVKPIIWMVYISPGITHYCSSLLDRIWYDYNQAWVTSKQTEAEFFSQILTTAPSSTISMVIADLGPLSPLSEDQKNQIKASLSQQRCPLISITDTQRIIIEEQNPHWLHIQLPLTPNGMDIEEANNAIANYWFNKPALNRPAL